MLLSIATGKSRKTKQWRNEQTTWEALAFKLSKTIRTPESYRDYINFPREKQAEIKDQGGFVGGFLTEGARHPNTVKLRQVVTLDLDFANSDFWYDFTMFYNVAAVIHSTHKHSDKTPRYRLVLPLDRPVTSEEYEAISRKLAGNLDINLFDPTTFQPHRLMYWPTTSKDAVYFFREQKGKPLNADQVLRSYVDWQDMSSWPKPDAEKEFITKNTKLQGDPKAKPGFIGAFCRTYDIHQAIAEFLPDVYETTSFEDRYTFIGGSAAAGAIVYSDEFLYSHHGTDPIQGQLVNSFDLVRLHLFGSEDTGEGVKEITKRASYRKMCDFAAAIPDVKKQVSVARLPAEDFDDFYSTEWLGKLSFDKYSKYEPKSPNFKLILANDVNLRGRLLYDRFNQHPVVETPVPWDEKSEGRREFTDDDESGLRLYLEQKYDIYQGQKLGDALRGEFNKNSYHPITDYIDTLEWDGVCRLDTMLIDYLGAPDTRFTRLATRKAFVAAVARVYRPGCKFDYVLTLIGKEGIKKSTLFAKLAGEWFSDSFNGVTGKEAFEQLQGTWIMEMGELSGIKKHEAEAVKHFITKQKDKYRVAYGKRNQTFPRQCVFFGTTNEFTFLKENNGNRRFWPVVVNDYGELDIDDLPVDQIWAEAKRFFDAGEKLYLDVDVEEEAREAQAYHTELDERQGLITAYLDMLLPLNWHKKSIHERRAFLQTAYDDDSLEERGTIRRDKVCVAEIWCELFEGDYRTMTTNNTKYIHSILNELPRWQKRKSSLVFSLYGRQRTYELIPDKILKRK